MKSNNFTTFFLNGSQEQIQGSDNLMMLGDWLRRRKGMAGTKIVCAEGDCGACTVLVAQPPQGGKSEFLPMNSCIALVGQMHGASVVTIEGLEKDRILSPVQSAMISCHGSQCGYCTPGFVMALTGLVEKKLHSAKNTSKLKIDEQCAKNALTGNLCRCTGYQPIIEAAKSITESKDHNLHPRYFHKEIQSKLAKECKTPVSIVSDGHSYYCPTSLVAACKLMSKYSKTIKILGSTTDLGVQYNKGRDLPKEFLSLKAIPTLRKISVSGKRITVGSQASLESLRTTCKTIAPELARLIDVFASPQIKNFATLVGNIANASPIGDTIPYLLTSNCIVLVSSWKSNKISSRKIPLENFYLGYKKLALAPREIISAVSFDLETPKDNQSIAIRKAFKVSARKDLDISAVSAAFHLEISKLTPSSEYIVEDFRIAFGGVAATPIRMQAAESSLVSKPLHTNHIATLLDALGSQIEPLSDHRGSSSYRRVLIRNLTVKFFREVGSELNLSLIGGKNDN